MRFRHSKGDLVLFAKKFFSTYHFIFYDLFKEGLALKIYFLVQVDP